MVANLEFIIFINSICNSCIKSYLTFYITFAYSSQNIIL